MRNVIGVRVWKLVPLLWVISCSSGEKTADDGLEASAAGVAGVATAGTVGGASGFGGMGAGTSSVGNAGMSVAGAAGTAAGTGGMAGMLSAGDGAAGTLAGTGGAGIAGGDAGSAGTGAIPTERFSFFVTSLRALRELSGSQDGFGGDLSYGETGEGAGLRGADKICTEIAERSMPGAGAKGWRAFLSAVAAGPGGTPVHAIDRIGEGPWYDRLGRLFGNEKSELISFRPTMADDMIVNDLPNEDGVPNHNPDGTGEVDNHDTLTGSNDQGQVYAMDMGVTCNDWTNAVPEIGADAPRVGHSWPRLAGGGGMFPGGFGGGMFPGGGGIGGPGGSYGHWISSLSEAGCGPGVFLIEMGPPMASNPTVGSGGGYGGFYCFALMP